MGDWAAVGGAGAERGLIAGDFAGGFPFSECLVVPSQPPSVLLARRSKGGHVRCASRLVMNTVI